jgi:hypothetical protein
VHEDLTASADWEDCAIQRLDISGQIQWCNPALVTTTGHWCHHQSVGGWRDPSNTRADPPALADSKLCSLTEKYVNELKEPKEFFEWLVCTAGKPSAICAKNQEDLSSLGAAGPRSKMMDRRNSTADTGNGKKDYTRDNIAHICGPCQVLKRSLPEEHFMLAASCCAVAYYSAYNA